MGIVNAKLNKTAQLFGLMSDPTRLKIVQILFHNEELCVTQISKKSGLTLSATSHQLRKLELLGIVGKCRYGQTVCYCINKKNLLAKKMYNLLKII